MKERKGFWERVFGTGPNLGGYFRELSVVIIGVAVTFIGTDLISAHTRRQEIRENMRLIRSELEANRANVILVRDCIANDIGLCLRIRQEEDFFEAPADSLSAAQEELTTLQLLSYTKDALEVFKMSSLMQYVNDKDLLLQVIQAYGKLDRANEAVSLYYNKKTKVFESVSKALSPADEKLIRTNGILGVWEVYLNNNDFRRFIQDCPNFLNMDSFGQTLQMIDDTVARIETSFPE